MNNEPGRQIHLDFHTSEHIEGIGARFSKTQFQEALQTGHVNLINLFAKCHHSWSYYPTKIGKAHPHLEIDLLGEQIEACHEIGVMAPIYFTVGWSAYDAEQHPDWCMRTETGEISASQPWQTGAGQQTAKPTFQWKHLCPSGDYHELIKAQTEEICKLYPTDGFWYDIYQSQVYCYCDACKAGMHDTGMNAGEFRALTIKRHCEDLIRLIQDYHPGASIYFNGLTNLERPENLKYKLYQWNTKQDLEDLPTTWGGYDKFPIRSKFFHREDKAIVAMSGKFHTAWGEFGGFKAREALKYEAASMIAFGARCNFGDQLHPSGAMDMSTYSNIGEAYEYVERIEHLGIGGTPQSNLGFWIGNDAEADEGVVRMLLEEQLDFEVILPNDDLGKYQTVIVPSVPGILDGHAKTIQAYLADGGTMLVLGNGILNAKSTDVALPSAGTFVEVSQFDMDFTVASDGIAEGLPASPFLNYSSGVRLQPAAESQVLADIKDPYFSRTYETYCGHQNAPYRLESSPYPAVYRKDGLIVCSHAIDRMYYLMGARVHRSLFRNTLALINTEPMVEADLPSSGRINLLHFAEEKKYVLHLLYASPLQRGKCLVIEDLPIIRNVDVRLRLPVAAKEIRLEPDGVVLDVVSGRESGQRVLDIQIPEFSCHCALSISYV